MSKSNGSVEMIPRMLSPERSPAQVSLPPLPVMTPEYSFGGEWMSPQWKQDLGCYKKLFSGYPLQMVSVLVAAVALGFGLSLLSAAAGCGTSVFSKNTEGAVNADSSYSSDRQDEEGYLDGEEYGDIDQSIDNTEGDDDASAQPASSPSGLLGTGNAVSGSIGEYGLAIEGYKLINNFDGNPSILVSYRFTNNSSETKPFYMCFNHKAFQNGVQLEVSYAMTDEFDNQAQTLDVEPGASHTVCALYTLSDPSAPVKVNVSDLTLQRSDTVETTFDIGAN